MSLLLEQSPPDTDKGHQNLLGQYVRTILAVVDELVSQMPLEAQIWAEQARQELRTGVELIEQEIALLGLEQICALRRTLHERDQQIAEFRGRLEGPPGPPTMGGEAPLVSSQFMDAETKSPGRVSPDPIPANQPPSDTLENLFEDLEGSSVQSAASSPEMPTLSEQPVMTDVIEPAKAVEADMQPVIADSSDSGTLRQDFQQLQTDLDQQKQQLASITSVVDQQKAENQKLQSLVSVLEEKLSQKETDLEKSMIRSLLLEAGLDPDVA
jgi:hypothetical protein